MKYTLLLHLTFLFFVTPLVGVWIEITIISNCSIDAVSLPLWECGLKYFVMQNIIAEKLVTPLVGVWIEIMSKSKKRQQSQVTPLVGVWIEISYWTFEIIMYSVTPLVGVWIEILQVKRTSLSRSRHSPCGSVD